MTNTEFECSILDYDIVKFKEKLKSLNIVLSREDHQKRYVYDFNPVNPNSWIRLRTNGKETTLAIKDIKDKKAIGGTVKLEIEVESFIVTNEILSRMGYHPRNYQENNRTQYILDDVEIDIDSWPLITTYVELEGKSKKSVEDIIEKLELDRTKITALDVQSVYNEYGIDISKIKTLKF